MKTWEQLRAAHAWAFLDASIGKQAGASRGAEWLQRLRQCARETPGNVLTLGLATTMAMLAAEDANSAQHAVFDCCSRWLFGEACPLCTIEHGDLLRALCVDCSPLDYFNAQTETEQFLLWLKKLAVARIDDKGATRFAPVPHGS